jgi:transposase
LRVTLPNGVPYYKDTSKIRKLDCPLPEALSIKEATVLYQFGDLLRSINLPERWQETISAWVSQGNAEDRRAAHLEQRRLELEAEQKRLVTAFAKGYLTEEDLDAQVAPLRAELFALPLRLAHNAVQETLNVGETLEEVASYWSEAAHEQRQEIVTGFLAGEGLIYDLERRAIVGLLPHASVLPVLTLGLQHTAQWEQRDGGLWLLQDSWPPKQDLTKRHIPPPPPPSLSPAQREEAVKLLHEPGMSLRNVASRLGTSRATIHRLAQQEGIQLQPSRKLSDEQRLEAFALLEQGMSLRQVAKQFGIGAESLRRLVARHTSSGER